MIEETCNNITHTASFIHRFKSVDTKQNTTQTRPVADEHAK